MTPPDTLYHGTAQKYVKAIRRRGLVPTKARDAADLDPPVGVWLTSMYSYAKMNTTAGGRRPGTVLTVDVQGLDLRPYGFGVWLSLEPIPAKRIRV
jgi:RNA:NAD 2'-phosphotransferase (TPT1/KptA family)